MNRLPDSAVFSSSSRILVTGVNGLVGSHVADQCLRVGLHVRGTVRNLERSKWLAALFEQKYGKDCFQLVQVATLDEAEAVGRAMKDCTAVIHTASPTLLSGDPNEVITPAKAITISVLEAAIRNPQVKRLVFTSSTSACASAGPKPSSLVQDSNTWNDKMVELAERLEPPWSQENCMMIYEASKVIAERTLWEFVKYRRPHFEVNTVLPSFCLGTPLDVTHQGFPSSLMVTKMFLDGVDGWQIAGPMWCIDVQDAALLHVAALLHPEVQNERIYGCADPWSWNIMAAKLKEVAPESNVPDPLPDFGADESQIAGRARAEGLLQWLGRPGFSPFSAYLRRMSEAMSTSNGRK